MKKKLTRKNLIAWARDLYSCDGKWEYWYDLSAYSFPPSGHSCGCVVGELAHDFGGGSALGSGYYPSLSFLHALSQLLSAKWWELENVNDDAPDGPERAKAVQAFILRRLLRVGACDR